MRIGILTLPLHTNYGGILQAYALQTVLERMGHEASVITTSNKAELPVWKWPYSYPKRMIRKYILGKTEVKGITYSQYVELPVSKEILNNVEKIQYEAKNGLVFVYLKTKMPEKKSQILIEKM